MKIVVIEASPMKWQLNSFETTLNCLWCITIPYHTIYESRDGSKPGTPLPAAARSEPSNSSSSFGPTPPFQLLSILFLRSSLGQLFHPTSGARKKLPVGFSGCAMSSLFAMRKQCVNPPSLWYTSRGCLSRRGKLFVAWSYLPWQDGATRTTLWPLVKTTIFSQSWRWPPVKLRPTDWSFSK